MPEASRSFHYWQPASSTPMAGKSWQPSHEPPCSKGTGTRHTLKTVEKREGKGWEENCLGDELPDYGTQENASCTYATFRYATIHKHVEFRHLHICVDTADLQGNTSALCC